MTNELTVSEFDISTTALAQYGTRDEVGELVARLMVLHPAVQRGEVGKPEMRTVAQMAIVTGANPIPGTNGIHVWKNKGQVQFAFGIGFLRTCLEASGGVYWLDKPRQMTKEEKAARGIEPEANGAYCRAALKPDIRELLEMARDFGEPMTIREAAEQVAREGFGVSGVTKVNKQGERYGTDYAKEGRDLLWSAQERAERDLIRKLVPNYSTNGRVRMWQMSDFTRPEPAIIDVSPAEVDEMLFGKEPEALPERTIDAATGELLDREDYASLDAFVQAYYLEHQDEFNDARDVKSLVLYQFTESYHDWRDIRDYLDSKGWLENDPDDPNKRPEQRPTI